MSKDVAVLLVGTGGYGQGYVEALPGLAGHGARIAGAVETRPENLSRLRELFPDTPSYETMEEFYRRHNADLAVISTPFHLHRAQCITALEHGSHVLCEKPLCSTVEDAREIINARDRVDRFVAVGYQWCYSDAVRELKRDALAGRLGRPKRMRTIVLSPRNDAYYNRAPWAGRLRDEGGVPVLDSVAANACAHYLFNMLYVLGGSMEESAWPGPVTAELYRANPIESFDTVATRIWTVDGVELLFYASHATREALGPVFHYEYERADVYFDTDWEGQPDHRNPTIRRGNIWAAFRDGSHKVYGNPHADEMRKLELSIRAARGESVGLCPVEAAMAHTDCIARMHRAAPIFTFPASMVTIGSAPSGADQIRFVPCLEEEYYQCYNRCVLPGEARYSGRLFATFKHQAE